MFHRDGPACVKARTSHDDNVAHGTSSCRNLQSEGSGVQRESGYRVAHSRQVARCHPMETLEHLDADSEMDAISDIQPVQNVTPNVC